MRPLHTFTALMLLAGLLGSACSAGKSAVPAFSQKPINFNPDAYVDSSLPEIKNSDEYTIPDVLSAMFVAKALIEYPEKARLHRIQGRIELKVYIDEMGTIQYIENLKPIGFGLDEQVISAVQRSNFDPGTYRGKPIKMSIIVPFHFKLGDQISF